MAVLTAQGISRVAVALLTRQLVLPRTVTMVPGTEFDGDNGDTITVRVPQPRAARTQSTRSADITYDDANEVPVDVTMSHLYNGHLLSDEEAQFDIENFAMQITKPQVEAVAVGAEDLLATAMNDLSADLSFANTADPDQTDLVIKLARQALSEADVPASDRYLAVAPSITTRLLDVDKFVRADALGDGPSSALRDAVIGRIYGFTVVESNGLDTDTAVAYHKSGFAFANYTPKAPRGANDSAATTVGGIGLRQIFDYIPTKLSDASVVSTFAGAAAVADTESADSLDDFPRSVKIDVAT